MGTHEHTGYGFFKGGDPRKFTPDEPDEQYRKDCAEWAAGMGTDIGTSDVVVEIKEPDGRTHHGIGTRGTYGPGVYTLECDDPACEEGLEDAERAEQPSDPTDALAAFKTWWDWDGQIIDPTREDIMRDAFVAGFRARMELEDENPF
jgi:hypothetical protein